MKKRVCFVLILSLFLGGCSFWRSMEIHIFGDIQECSKLEELKEPDATIEIVAS